MHDAIAAGSRWTYLGVFDENVVARRMYERPRVRRCSAGRRRTCCCGDGSGSPRLAGRRPDLADRRRRADRGAPRAAGGADRRRRAARARAASSSGRRDGAAGRDRRAVHGRPAGGRARAPRRGRRGHLRRAARAARSTRVARGRRSGIGSRCRARSVGRRSSRRPARTDWSPFLVIVDGATGYHRTHDRTPGRHPPPGDRRRRRGDRVAPHRRGLPVGPVRHRRAPRRGSPRRTRR